MHDNPTHSRRAKSPRLETEAGIVKEVSLEQQANAQESILQTVAGESKVTSVNSMHDWKQPSPITRTHFATLTERRPPQTANPKAGSRVTRDAASKTRVRSLLFLAKLPADRAEILYEVSHKKWENNRYIESFHDP
jgi:hypothetical protein